MAPANSDLSSAFEEAARRVEAELKRWMAEFNSEVMPAMRRDGGKALRTAAEKLHQLADRLDRERDGS